MRPIESTYYFDELSVGSSLHFDLEQFAKTFIREHSDEILDVRVTILWR